MKNVIIIPTCNEYRIRMFDEYFNVYNQDHNMRLIFIADDRNKISRDAYTEIFKSLKHSSLYELHFSSDVISDVRHLFSDAAYFDNILNSYKLSIKLLIFIWAKHKLNINKSMLLDDDVLFFKPIDHIFDKNDYVKKTDGLSWLCAKSRNALQDVYPEIDINDFEKDKSRKINSGSIIYTWDDSHDLVGWVHRVFNSEKLSRYVMRRAYLHTIGKGNIHRGTGWGRSWIMEQYVYGMFMNKIGFDRWESFSSYEINTGVNLPKDGKIKQVKNLPNIVHFLPANKKPLYEYYIKCIKHLI